MTCRSPGREQTDREFLRVPYDDLREAFDRGVPGAEAPTGYWLSNPPADTPLAELVRPARVRRRIGHDYREHKHGLGLHHFEGRSWTGWHHHVTLVTAAHAFLTEQRLAPEVPAPASPSTRSSTPSRAS